jgi:uncharacterized protein (TIGR02246 family)
MKALLKVLLVFVTLCGAAPILAENEAEVTKIRALAVDWEHAWNKHDMKSLAALFTEDADFVNVGAKHWKGRKEIEAQHAARLSQFIESIWETSGIEVQFLRPDVALVHVSWGLKGDKDPDGSPRQPREGIFTWVAIKEQGKWLIRAAQNTNRSNLPAPQVAK